MNKIAKSIAVSLLALSAGSAWATDGKIEFTGEILTSTCEFADGDVINVELGHYAAAQFKTVGDTSPAIPVNIPLENCPASPWEHVDGTTDQLVPAVAGNARWRHRSRSRRSGRR